MQLIQHYSPELPEGYLNVGTMICGRLEVSSGSRAENSRVASGLLCFVETF